VRNYDIIVNVKTGNKKHSAIRIVDSRSSFIDSVGLKGVGNLDVEFIS